MIRIGSFRPLFVLCTLGFLATAAYFQMRGVSALIASALGSGEPQRARAAPRFAQVQLPRTADAILTRNPFDSVTGPLLPPRETKRAAQVAWDPLLAPECDSPLAVIVTESRVPIWSRAALRTSVDAEPHDHRVGDVIAGKTVQFIGYNPQRGAPAVWLSSAEGLCQSLLFKPAAPLSAKVSESVSAPLAEPRVTARAVQSALLTRVRVVPEQKDGRVIGIRLFGIGRDSLLALIGLQNGDRLESINGYFLGTPEQALAAYAHLRVASRLDVKVVRQGQPMTLGYRIN